MSADFAIIIIHLHVNKIAPELPQNRSEVTEFQGFVRIERDYYGGNFSLESGRNFKLSRPYSGAAFHAVIPTEERSGPPPCHPDRRSGAAHHHVIPTEGAKRPTTMSSRPKSGAAHHHVIPTEERSGPPPCHPDRRSEATERRDLWDSSWKTVYASLTDFSTLPSASLEMTDLAS